MPFLWRVISEAFLVLKAPESELWDIILRSYVFSGLSTVLACTLALPLGLALSMWDSRIKRFLVSIVQTSIAIPSVLIGLVVYLMTCRVGPLGSLELLFNPSAIILAQTLLAFPLIVTLTHSAMKTIAIPTRDLARSLGATPLQTSVAIFRQGRFAILTATITGFSRVLGETGMTMMVGGNIRGLTRVMTTSIALETMKGNFELGLALGGFLLVSALFLNMAIHFWQNR